MILRIILILIEVLAITVMNYYMASSYYSLDVLYCLPVIQTASFSALHVQSKTDSLLLPIIAIFCAIAWSLAEALVSWPNFPISAFVMNVFTRGITFTVIGRVITKLWKTKTYLREDSLTGLANRSEFIEYLKSKQLQSEGSGRAYSLLIFNIDNFRELNNKHGHQAGDEALVLLASTLLENSRGDDMASRIGGDEFILLLAESNERLCSLLCDKITLAAERKFIQNGWEITLSSGKITETGNEKDVGNLLKEVSEIMHFRKKSKYQNSSIRKLA